MKTYVGGMSFKATEQGPRAAFAAHGKVSSASIIADRTTGRSPGFGFVEMQNASEARAAMEAMNEAKLDGRILTVNEAREGRGPRRRLARSVR